MSYKQYVNNPYVGWQKCYCLDYPLTHDQYIAYVQHLEQETGLNLMADTTNETLQGFVTMCANPLTCWDGQSTVGGHSCIIVSLYGTDKPYDYYTEVINGVTFEYGTPQVFEETPITDGLESTLDLAHNSYVPV